MSKSTYINLINVIPKEISESVEFWIKRSSKHFEKVEVPCGGRMQFKTNPKDGVWHVYAVVGGIKTETYSTIFSDDSYVCRIRYWSNEIFNRKLTKSDISMLISERSVTSTIDRLSDIVKAKDFLIFREVSQVLLSQYSQQQENAILPLMEVVKILSQGIFDEFDVQDELRDSIVSNVLDNYENLSLTEKTFFMLQLTPQPTPKSKSAYSKWTKTISKSCESWLDVLGEVDTDIDPEFNLNVLPEINFNQTDEKANRANKEAVKVYNQQFLLRQLQKRLINNSSRYFSLIPQVIRTREQFENEALAIDDQCLQLIKKSKISVIPEDNFAGRDLKRFGAGERINLSLPQKIGLEKEQANQLRWVCRDGSGYFLNNCGGEAIYVAGSKQELAILSLVNIKNPKSHEVLIEQEIDTAVPNDARMERQDGSHIMHQYDTFSAGFKGEIYLLPNVSYSELLFREGSAPGVGTGWFSDDTGDQHPVGDPITIHNNKVNGVDTVSTGIKHAPYAEGTFDWPIPWEYKEGGSPWEPFTIANHAEVSDGTGRASIEKKGAGPFTKDLDAPTSGY